MAVLTAEVESARAKVAAVQDAAKVAAGRHTAAQRKKDDESKRALAAVVAESERKADLCNLLSSRQANSLKMLAEENSSLLAMLAGLPSLTKGVANAPAPTPKPPARTARPSSATACADATNVTPPAPLHRRRPQQHHRHQQHHRSRLEAAAPRRSTSRSARATGWAALRAQSSRWPSS